MTVKVRCDLAAAAAPGLGGPLDKELAESQTVIDTRSQRFSAPVSQKHYDFKGTRQVHDDG
jgi:hypothetical protein